MSLIPGLGLVKGMALTLRRFFQPKVTHLWFRSSTNSFSSLRKAFS